MIPAGFTERRVSVGANDIRLLESGDGPPFVFLHGGGGLMLTTYHQLLARSFRVIAFEMPGFDDTRRDPGPNNLEELADTMLRAREAAGIKGEHTLAGVSFGGATALQMALLRPRGIGTLVLIAPASFRPKSHPRPDPAQMPGALVAHPELWPVREASTSASASVVHKMQLVGRLVDSFDQAATQARLSEITIPTLVLFGTEDRMIPPAMGRIYREWMPACSFVLVPDAGHELGVDRPEDTAALITDFIRRKEAFVIPSPS